MGEDQGEFELRAYLSARLEQCLVVLVAQHRPPRTRLFREREPLEGVSLEQIAALPVARHGGPVEHGANGLQVQCDHAVPNRLSADLPDSTIAPLPAAMDERLTRGRAR